MFRLIIFNSLTILQNQNSRQRKLGNFWAYVQISSKFCAFLVIRVKLTLNY